MNLGLRYEYQTNPENAVKYPAINPATVLTDSITAVYRVKEDRNNFAPRVGFAYNPHNGVAYLADGKTVYHGAVGIFYDVLFTNITDNSQRLSPNVQSPNLTSGTGRGLANANTLVPTLVPLTTISPLNTTELTSNNLVNPETFQWNLGVERQLPGEIKLTINYVASRSEKLFSNQQYNYYAPGTPGVRINPARGVIIARVNGADSEYQSARLSSRMTSGMDSSFVAPIPTARTSTTGRRSSPPSLHLPPMLRIWHLADGVENGARRRTISATTLVSATHTRFPLCRISVAPWRMPLLA